MKKALLIVNLGTPNKPTYFSVFKYLKQFLIDIILKEGIFFVEVLQFQAEIMNQKT